MTLNKMKNPKSNNFQKSNWPLISRIACRTAFSWN